MGIQMAPHGPDPARQGCEVAHEDTETINNFFSNIYETFAIMSCLQPTCFLPVPITCEPYAFQKHLARGHQP